MLNCYSKKNLVSNQITFIEWNKQIYKHKDYTAKSLVNKSNLNK